MIDLSPRTGRRHSKRISEQTVITERTEIQDGVGNKNLNFPLSPDMPGRKRASLPARCVSRLLARFGNPPLQVVLPNGEVVSTSRHDTPTVTIRFRDYRVVWAVALDPWFQFPEGYASGRIEIEGNLSESLAVIYRLTNHRGKSAAPGLWSRLRRPRANSLRHSQENIHHHYDIGNDFYRLWLDEEMLYTCAYFEQPDLTLEQAQVAKMEHVCRKLQLKPGMRVVEAGCGWGALAMHMARHYGVRVTAFNISQEQVAWARDRVTREGLGERVEFVHDDWRNIEGQFDAFASVGMLEHVGTSNYEQLGATIRKCLHPQGIGLIHSIGQNWPARLNPWIERRIFPGAYPPSLQEMMPIFEAGELSVLDIENIRLHYAETLRHWLERFENAVDEVRDQFGESFVRIWRFYLAGSVAAFDSGCLQLYQVLFAPALSNSVPRTREHVYRPAQQRLPASHNAEASISEPAGSTHQRTSSCFPAT